MVGSLILGRTMRDSKDDDEAEAAIGAGQVALVAPSSGGLACIFGASEGAAAPGATAASFSGGAVSALGVSSSDANCPLPQIVPASCKLSPPAPSARQLKSDPNPIWQHLRLCWS